MNYEKQKRQAFAKLNASLKDIAIRMARGEKIRNEPAPERHWTEDKSWGVGDGPLKSDRSPWT
jgi:hypothetical protein